jgi:hypothetical protein
MVSNSQVRIVMKRFVFAMVTVTLVGFGMLATTGLARAIIAPIMSPSQSVMQAQAVILGKVTEIEKETVKAEQYPGNPKQDFVIAKVKVNENLYGLKEAKEIRIGTIKPVPPPPPVRQPEPNVDQPIVRPILPRPVFNVTLTEGQEACFFLQKHHSGDFYLLVPMSTPLPIDNKSEIEKVRKILAVFNDPLKNLRSRNLADRGFAAAVLVMKYRSPNYPGKIKEEPIPAEESQLILRALAEADWTVKDFSQPNPRTAFDLLGAAQAGYVPPRVQPGQPFNPQEYQMRLEESAKAWLRDNAETFQVKRYVPDR